MAAMLCGLTACHRPPRAEISSKHPDKALFERATSAVEHKRYDVAHVTLQILVNTYPNSKYASKARLLLVAPRIAKCDETWFTPDLCDGGFAATPSAH
jgi:outer membrane protein assembly factor BamD (BamD/ComL family)